MVVGCMHTRSSVPPPAILALAALATAGHLLAQAPYEGPRTIAVTEILPEMLLTSVPFSVTAMAPSTRSFERFTFCTGLFIIFTDTVEEGVTTERAAVEVMLKAMTPLLRETE